MTTIRTHRPASRQSTVDRRFPHDHIVVGTSTQLDNIITNHRRLGTLVDVATAHRLPDGRHRVTLRLYDTRPTPPTVPDAPAGPHARSRIRRGRLAVIVTAITGSIAGLVAVTAYLIGQLVELVAAHAGLLLGVLALAAILAAAVLPSRRHCPGC